MLGVISEQGNETEESAITLPKSLFSMLNASNTSEQSISILFGMYQTAVFFPLATSRVNYTLGSTVLSATVVGHNIADLTENVSILLQLHDPVR